MVRQWQVIFRQREGIRNLNYYVETETPEDARLLARKELAADTLKPECEVGRAADWIIVETNDLENS